MSIYLRFHNTFENKMKKASNKQTPHVSSEMFG